MNDSNKKLKLLPICTTILSTIFTILVLLVSNTDIVFRMPTPWVEPPFKKPLIYYAFFRWLLSVEKTSIIYAFFSLFSAILNFRSFKEEISKIVSIICFAISYIGFCINAIEAAYEKDVKIGILLIPISAIVFIAISIVSLLRSRKQRIQNWK